MKKVKNLSELIGLVGEDTVDKCFTEYMMLKVAKANELDQLKDILERYTLSRPEKEQVHLTCRELQEIIDGNYTDMDG